MPKLSAEKEQALEERRWKIWRLRVVRKLDICEIVKLVGISRRTVAKDLAEMRDVRSDHIRLAHAEQQEAIDAAIEVAEQCDAVCRQAWADLDAAKKGSFARAKFLNTVLNAVRSRIEILQSVGLLPRSAEEVIISEGSIRDLSDKETNELIDRLKAEIRREGGPGADAGQDRREHRRAGRKGRRGATA